MSQITQLSSPDIPVDAAPANNKEIKFLEDTMFTLNQMSYDCANQSKRLFADRSDTHVSTAELEKGIQSLQQNINVFTQAA